MSSLPDSILLIDIPVSLTISSWVSFLLILRSLHRLATKIIIRELFNSSTCEIETVERIRQMQYCTCFFKINFILAELI